MKDAGHIEVHSDSIVSVCLASDTVDDLLVVPLFGERSKPFIPQDKDMPVVSIDTISIFSMMHAMMRRGHQNTFDQSELWYHRRVHPVRVDPVDVMMNDELLGRNDQREWEINEKREKLMKVANSHSGEEIQILGHMMEFMDLPEEGVLMPEPMLPVAEKIDKN